MGWTIISFGELEAYERGCHNTIMEEKMDPQTKNRKLTLKDILWREDIKRKMFLLGLK